MEDKLIQEEIAKHHKTAIERLSDTRESLKKDLDYNQKLWNDLLQSGDWNEKTIQMSCVYIKEICTLIDAINKLNQIKIAPDKKDK